MSIHFDSVAFVPKEVREPSKRAKRASGHATAGSKPKGSGQSIEAAVVTGQPLPDFGTCRHYPHSHRQAYLPILEFLQNKLLYLSPFLEHYSHI